MDWSKVDPALAGALDEGRFERFVVFVHLAGPAESGDLSEMGVEASGSGPIRTATVSAGDIERLSDDPLVISVRLSRPLGLADPG